MGCTPARCLAVPTPGSAAPGLQPACRLGSGSHCSRCHFCRRLPPCILRRQQARDRQASDTAGQGQQLGSECRVACRRCIREIRGIRGCIRGSLLRKTRVSPDAETELMQAEFFGRHSDVAHSAEFVQSWANACTRSKNDRTHVQDYAHLPSNQSNQIICVAGGQSNVCRQMYAGGKLFTSRRGDVKRGASGSVRLGEVSTALPKLP